MCSCLRHKAVTAEVESVSQSIGRPINVATKNGFRSTVGDPPLPSVEVVTAWRPAPVTCFSGGPPVPCFGSDPRCASEARGVGHIFACVGSVGSPLLLKPPATPCVVVGVPHIRTVASVNVTSEVDAPPDRFASVPVGVGHCLAAPLSSGSAPLSPDRIPLPCTSVAFGVGHDPDALASVRCSNGCRAEQAPFRIEPEVGKVVEDMGEPESNKLGDVLQQDELGSHVSDDGCDGRPEPAVIVNPSLLSSRAERLAGEPGSDEIHSATPRLAVEGGEVIPDRSVIQARLAHPFHEDGRCVGVPLNVSHGSYPCHGSEGELEPSVAGAEVDGR